MDIHVAAEKTVSVREAAWLAAARKSAWAKRNGQATVLLIVAVETDGQVTALLIAFGRKRLVVGRDQLTVAWEMDGKMAAWLIEVGRE